MQFGLIAAGIAMLLAVFGPVEGAELGIKHSRGKREGKGISFLDDRTQQFFILPYIIKRKQFILNI